MTDPRHSPSRPRLGTLARDLFARARRDHTAREAAHRMRMLDDHLLRDIGINREDIDILSREGRR